MLHLLFPTHLAMGYLVGAYSRFPIAYLVIGAALPDVVDRPLFWLGLTPFTHTVVHSVAIALPVCVGVSYLYGRPGVAFSIGWLLHLAADFLNVVTTQGLAMAPYYVLYLTPPPAETYVYPTVTISLPFSDITHVAHPGIVLFELVIIGWALGVVLRRGDLRRLLRRERA